MPLTLGLTGMDPATQSAFTTAFEDANARLGGHWDLIADTEAAHVAVDMDSMYGPMSWIRLHALGKSVIGITSAPRTQTDYRLAHPFDDHSVGQLLQEIAQSIGQPLAVEAATGADNAPAGKHDNAADATPSAQPSADAPAVAHVEKAAAATATAAAAPDPGSQAPAPTQAPQKASVPEPRTLAEWLAAGRLDGRIRFERDGKTLLIDTAQGQYHGPPTLKPLVAHVSEPVGSEDFVALDDKTWAHEVAALGKPMPLGRLLWFTALSAGKGTLAEGFDPDGRFQMLKWPQTEREYPKHFRIATAMMKGPATLADIAAASSVPQADVTDFVNASLASGFADIEHLPQPQAEPATKAGGLFGRFRSR